ncbi:hypothetical protein SCALIN_C24_0046 [Candidatus Scalindua japonica]|uniref:PEGA domain-containing protein n=1 Tax=Candidatus Scalindua japonica TaxID=1284222 RepID=A0A286U090_9BACT|nr:PEGA domain-containing protein [Candidatus Scalindua japonica]GAX61547.1 hypothetical protein SCALIN_C24_0046 [Candidatus Scalindua japonica]
MGILKEKSRIKRQWEQPVEKTEPKPLYRLLSGTSSERIKSLATSFHKAEITKGQCEVWKENVDIEEGDENFFAAMFRKRTGSIRIKSEPSTAKIYLDGKANGYSPDSIRNVSPGIHEVEIRLDGYDVWSKKVHVDAYEGIVLNVLLQKRAGSIRIKSEPSTAKIYLDGNNISYTPDIIRDVTPGIHEIEIKTGGYNTWSKKVTVEAGEENDLTAVLQKRTGAVSLKSEPAMAKIFLDGNAIGLTPDIIRDIPPGSHKVEITLDGYDTWRKEVTVEAGRENALTAVLEKSASVVSIVSEPAMAKIFLNGNAIGITPAIIRDIVPGIHEVELTSDGYYTWRKKITVEAGEENALTATLQKYIDSIRIMSNPSMASIYFNGNALGLTPHRITDLKPDRYTVRIVKEGYKPWEEVVSVKSGNETLISAMLKYELVRLRSIYDQLPVSHVYSLPHLSIHETNKQIFHCHSTIKHDYEQKTINESKVIIDHTTELMWHQSGSKDYINLKKAIKWIKKANQKNYAGYNDWRLPTLEEASSLLEQKMVNNNFINPVFDKKQWGMWTGDKCGRSNAWIVIFVNGTMNQSHVGSAATFVRPVRSLFVQRADVTEQSSTAQEYCNKILHQQIVNRKMFDIIPVSRQN